MFGVRQLLPIEPSSKLHRCEHPTQTCSEEALQSFGGRPSQSSHHMYPPSMRVSSFVEPWRWHDSVRQHKFILSLHDEGQKSTMYNHPSSVMHPLDTRLAAQTTTSVRWLYARDAPCINNSPLVTIWAASRNRDAFQMSGDFEREGT